MDSPPSVNRTSSCTLFFDLNASDIPASYKLPFKKLAERGGNKEQVDSCDLNQFYSEYNAGSAYRILTPQPFSKQEFRLRSWGSTTVFDYEKFYNHLAAILRTSTKNSSGTVRLDCRSNPACTSSKTSYEALWNNIDMSYRSEGLNEALSEFVARYPLSIDVQNFLIGFSEETLFTTGILMLPITPYGVLAPMGRDEFYRSDVDLYGFTKVERRNAAGDTVWYLKIDLSKAVDSRIYSALSGQDVSSSPATFPDSAAIETNMTRQEWEKFKKTELVDTTLPLAKSDFHRGLIRRVEAQITADEQMYFWTRAVKHWWNSWDW